MLIFQTGYHHVTLHTNKQEQPTPNGRELSILLALVCEYWWYSSEERQEQKALISLKSTERDFATISVFG